MVVVVVVKMRMNMKTRIEIKRLASRRKQLSNTIVMMILS